jgi:hypothetical protein
MSTRTRSGRAWYYCLHEDISYVLIENMDRHACASTPKFLIPCNLIFFKASNALERCKTNLEHNARSNSVESTIQKAQEVKARPL